MNQTAAHRDDLPAGTIVADRYEIIEAVGHGAIGVVYKARHTFMDRIVAIKMLKADHRADEKTAQRFQQEAKAISNLSHPNIITVFDFGISSEGRAFLVMDYVDGLDLDQYILESGRLTVIESIEVFAQICEALKHAHEKGIIHRDLKPGNVVIMNNSELSIKLVDFGMARVTDAKALRITQPGEVFGSPYYMSPEQFSGGVIDEKSDIYSLGCLLYESLTGRPPFLGEDVMEVVQGHLKELPESIIEQAEEDNENVPPELENLVFKMLEKDPADRYQKVSELLFDIKEIAYRIKMEGKRDTTVRMVVRRPSGSGDQQPALENKAGKAEKSEKNKTSPNSRKSNNKTVLGVVSVLAIIAVIAGGVMLVSPSPRSGAPKSPSEAEAAKSWDELDDEADKALQTGELETAEKLQKQALKLAEERGDKGVEDVPRSLAALGLIYHRQNRYELAESVFKSAIEKMKKLPNYDCAQLSPLLTQLGQLYEQEGRQKEAEEVHKRAIDIINYSFTAGAKTVTADCPIKRKRLEEERRQKLKQGEPQ